jgi:hypothetical protein
MQGETMARTTDETTNQLRAEHWTPRPEVIYLCGCKLGKLCPAHAERRAVEHYHPELIP